MWCIFFCVIELLVNIQSVTVGKSMIHECSREEPDQHFSCFHIDSKIVKSVAVSCERYSVEYVFPKR